MEYALFLLLVLYLLPWVTAEARDHPRARWILAVTLASGWTGVGWIGALWWARHPPEEPGPPELRVIPGAAERDRGPDEEALAARPALRVVSAGEATGAGRGLRLRSRAGDTRRGSPLRR